jgi:hypothetical protein
VDYQKRNVRVIRRGEPDIITRDRIEWRPAGTAESMVIDLPALFAEALDG